MKHITIVIIFSKVKTENLGLLTNLACLALKLALLTIPLIWVIIIMVLNTTVIIDIILLITRILHLLNLNKLRISSLTSTKAASSNTSNPTSIFGTGRILPAAIASGDGASNLGFLKVISPNNFFTPLNINTTPIINEANDTINQKNILIIIQEKNYKVQLFKFISSILTHHFPFIILSGEIFIFRPNCLKYSEQEFKKS